MKIDFWTRYSTLGASSRLRFYQFIPLLTEYGYDAECFPFFDDPYLEKLYAGKRHSVTEIFKYYRRRKKQLAAAAPDTPAVIEYELLPFMPFFMEAGFLKNRRYILNFDDAVDLHYAKNPLLKNKYPKLISHAAGIITANELLLEKFAVFNKNIIKLPTVPPSDISPAEPEKKGDILTLVWTGTPVTYRFLRERSDALQLAASKTGFKLLIVGGNPDDPINNVDCQYIPWSPANECNALSRAHAGIMPLPDTPFARGKSAYKLLCYLRAGIPGIASPVGENCRVIRNNENGFLAESDEQWAEAISRLAMPDIREKLSAAACADGKNYQPENAAKVMADFFDRTLKLV